MREPVVMLKGLAILMLSNQLLQLYIGKVQL